MEKTNVFQISTEPATPNNASSNSLPEEVQEVTDTSDFFKSSDDEMNEEQSDADIDEEGEDENEPENRSPIANEETEEDDESEEVSDDEETDSEDLEEPSETKNINAIANLVGSAATDSAFARKLYKGLCIMKDLIESLEARGVAFETHDNEEEEEDEEEEDEEEEEPETPLFETGPAVEKVTPLPNAENMLGTNIPLGEQKPTNESLTPPSKTTTPEESKTVLNTLTGILTGKTPLFSKTRRNKHRRTAMTV